MPLVALFCVLPFARTFTLPLGATISTPLPSSVREVVLELEIAIEAPNAPVLAVFLVWPSSPSAELISVDAETLAMVSVLDSINTSPPALITIVPPSVVVATLVAWL